MSSRLESELTGLRSSLEKGLASDVAEEALLDILCALKKIPISIELLRTTKIGQAVQNVKKLRAGEKSSHVAKDLISKWKQDCLKLETQAKASASSSSAEGDNQTADSKPASKEASSTSTDEVNDDSLYDQLSPIRRKMMNLFVEVFKVHTNKEVAKFLAFELENAINSINSADSDNKAYLTKVKSITYNLKKNERLRLDVVEGALPAAQLPHLSTNELATDQLRGEREETTKNATMARRSDLYEISRSDMLSSIGLDPNKGGEFCCRKCKGTKTTHYSLQTRSSDEPMTVFVCCLNCGNRWRTQ